MWDLPLLLDHSRRNISNRTFKKDTSKSFTYHYKSSAPHSLIFNHVVGPKIIIIIMRKKVLRLPTRQSKILPKPIVTFDDKDHNQTLLEPLPRKISPMETFIQNANILKMSAAEASSVCLANNQIMQNLRMIALHQHPIPDQTRPRNMCWISLNYCKPEDYEIFAEPEILKGSTLIEQHEESISFPLINFAIKRYNSITIKFKNIKGIRQERTLSGHAAWAFQQSLQQLDGVIPLDWRVNHGNMYFLDEALSYFPKSTAVIEEYVKDLKKVFEEYPNLITKKENFTNWKETDNEMHQELLPFEEDYYRRLVKHYQREMGLFHERMNDQGKERVWKEEKIDVEIIDK